MTRVERQAQTRAHLLDAAETVILREGFEGASVEAISAEAGYTRGAFYSNFPDKEQIFFELVADRAYAEYTRMLDRTPEGMSPREQLRWGAEELVARYERSEADESGLWLARLWLECLALAARNERFRELAASFWTGNRETMRQRIAVANSERGMELPVPARDLASSIIALDIGLFLQHLVDPEQVPLSVYPPLYDSLFGDLVDPQG